MAHYLVDLFGSPVTSSAINAVSYPQNGQTVMNGNFVVRVQDGIQISPPPTTLSDLLTKKHAGLLAFYAGFTHLAYDDLLDTADVDLTASVGMFGQRGTAALPPNGVGIFQTTMAPLTGSAPAYAVVTWELWEALDTDPATDRTVRTYSELPSSSSYATATVSFDNGATFISVTNGATLFIPLGNQGTSFILRLVNAHATKRVRVGSWAILY
jgi:hypothetical protein